MQKIERLKKAVYHSEIKASGLGSRGPLLRECGGHSEGTQTAGFCPGSGSLSPVLRSSLDVPKHKEQGRTGKKL